MLARHPGTPRPRSVRGVALSPRRQCQPRSHASPASRPARWRSPASRPAATGDDYARLVEHDALEGAFLTLSADHRIVLLLAHYAGYSAPEIATILSVPTGTVYSRLHYAMRAMRAALAPTPGRSGHHDGGTAMTQHDDSRITDWLAGGEGHGRGVALDAALAAARSTKQRPAWVVSLTGGTFAEPRGTVLLRRGIVVLGAGPARRGPARRGPRCRRGAAAAPAAATRPVRRRDRPERDSRGLRVRPDGSPSAAPSIVDRRRASWPTWSSTASDRGIARCTSHPWLAAADGRDAHVLDGHARRRLVGRRLEARARERQRRGWRREPARRRPDRRRGRDGRRPVHGPAERRQELRGAGNPGHLCPDQDEFALSPDGTRVAFTRTDPNVDNSSVVSVLDLATGQSTLLTGDAHHQPHGGRGLQHEHEDPHLPGVRRQPALVAGRPEHRLRASADGAGARRAPGTAPRCSWWTPTAATSAG